MRFIRKEISGEKKKGTNWAADTSPDYPVHELSIARVSIVNSENSFLP